MGNKKKIKEMRAELKNHILKAPMILWPNWLVKKCSEIASEIAKLEDEIKEAK